jgi:Zn-dependent peptidase ImmA (M78 family)/transcriptional regulator with XRE-family HTH domain
MASVGDMLRLARQRLGLTQKEAASRLDIAQPVLSRIENGVAHPESSLLMKAGLVYNVPRDFFDLLDPVYGPPVSVHAPMLRGKADVTGREIDMISAELNIRLMHMRRFLEGVDFSARADLPALDVEQYGTPEKIAATVRAHWGVPSGPIKNMVQLLERAGVVVGWSTFGGASVSGVTLRTTGLPPIVLLNAAHPADRMRYTLGHELGHLVMHRFPTANMETEANKFSSAFLMPATDIRPSFLGRKVTLQMLASLKAEWRVAMQALLYRASDLGCVTPNQARYLWQQISARGWKTREPLDTDFPAEQPRVITSIVRSHLDSLGFSVSELCRFVHVHESEFIQLYGLYDPPKNERPRLRIVG